MLRVVNIIRMLIHLQLIFNFYFILSKENHKRYDSSKSKDYRAGSGKFDFNITYGTGAVTGILFSFKKNDNEKSTYILLT